MINIRQQELIDSVWEKVKDQFPEVAFIDVIDGADSPDTLWIRVTCPEDEDRLLELIEFAGDITSDIHVEYGYHMLMMPTTVVGEALEA